VIVDGDLIGSIRALSISLQSKCHVEADLVCQNLAIEGGAFFNGKSRPSKNPLSGASASRNQAQAEPPSVSRKSQRDGVDSGHPINHPQ
jgi:cytoskeletal protein CcmA (bactofilin family)